jgi:tetratricopeptide (TPR) repeat protein
MTTWITLTLAYHGIELRCEAGSLREDRTISEKDIEQLVAWARRHQQSARYHKTRNTELLKIGEEMYAWLNGQSGYIERAMEFAIAPAFLEVRIDKTDDSERARAFWDAPWELLARNGSYLSIDPGILLCPIRRQGKPHQPESASPNRLSMIFMAAAPQGHDNLDFEAEEAAILSATREIEIDMVVEESGTLDRLSTLVAREKPHVLHLTCHGVLEPQPLLLLETDTGDPAFIKTTELLRKLGSSNIRLIFLSACQTAKPDPVTPSLSRSLIHAGAPAVIGWAESVIDPQATRFASCLYERLAKGETLDHAFAWARYDLVAHGEHPASDWHLARLYLAANGGGALATADGPRRRLGAGRAVKTFLDMKGQRVPVANEYEFVGRRRQIQDVLREFRTRGSQRHAGVLIHGLGGQGKSSLAARIAQRMESTHATVIVYERYDAAAILNAFAEALPTPSINQIIQEYLPRVEDTPALLKEALVMLLEQACDQVRRDTQGRVVTQPVLVIVDDFERALEAQVNAPHRVQPLFVEPMRALIQAFNRAATESRLMFTSRYEFDLLDERGRNLSKQLLSIPLHKMSSQESEKQGRTRLRLLSEEGDDIQDALVRLPRIIAASRGNPRLQNLLTRMATDQPRACDQCLSEMEAYLESGTLPDEQTARDFLEDLALDYLLSLLTPIQREWLRRSTLLELPAPTAALSSLSKDASMTDASRLIGLGLWEVYDKGDVAINAFCAAKAPLNANEKPALAALVCPNLLQEWRDERTSQQSVELTRLGLIAEDVVVLQNSSEEALDYLGNQFDHRRRDAATWAKAIIGIFDKSNQHQPSRSLLRDAAMVCEQIGDVEYADELRKRAFDLSDGFDDDEKGALYLEHARRLVQKGALEDAVTYFNQAQALAKTQRDKAVVLGDIARIYQSKGEVDQALALHQEQLAVYEALGDRRERAVTLGDIARIYRSKGEVDQALALHQEQLTIFEALGDKDGIANTLWSIAQIELQREHWQAAYDHLSESYNINLSLVRLDGICFVGFDLGWLLARDGHTNDAKALLTRSRDGFLKLGITQMAQATQNILDQLG